MKKESSILFNQFKINNINSSDESVRNNIQGQLKFLYEVCIYLENMKLISNKYDLYELIKIKINIKLIILLKNKKHFEQL
jgi:hypothetical protein